MEYKHILGATDFSELGDLALVRAAELAEVARARLTVLTVLPPAEMPSPLVPHYEITSGTAERERAIEAAREALAARVPEGLRDGPAELRYEVRIGDPTDEVLAADVELAPDLIVLGTHGRRGWSRIFMGSVSERVVQLARADVLTVRVHPPEQT